ncbi:hypothetical protein D6833_09055 [Candidatus Parcubacteria bacterium]|nr:MAG: hypothetical protein D6833_09055 [Candidatus Parcubacteria bacterium]
MKEERAGFLNVLAGVVAAIVALGVVSIYVARNVAFQNKGANSQPTSHLGAGTNEPSGDSKIPLQGSGEQEPTAPVIKILFPRKGEKWRAGSIHRIQWEAPSEKIRTVNISIEFTVLCPEIASSDCKTERKSLEIARDVQNSGSYDWEVRQVGSHPKIHIKALSESGEVLSRVTSDEFEILPPPQTVVVEIGSTDVVPATVHLLKGDAVRFLNKGKRELHLVAAALTKTPTPSGLEAPITIPPGESYAVTFPYLGEWEISDRLNPNIKVSISVRSVE